MEHKFAPFSRNDIEVTGQEADDGTFSPLSVRRGSEPALNQLSPLSPLHSSLYDNKRWSAAPVISDHEEEAPRPPISFQVLITNYLVHT